MAIKALFGSVTKNLFLAISRAMQGSDLPMSMAPYPRYGPVREPGLDFPAEHITLTRLEYRIGVLETRVAALQETVDAWDQWYHHWNPLFRLLHWMFGFMLNRN